MPYSFQASFTQPILDKLDSGVLKGADDWADAITKAYIATIKQGLPQGVPLTLPAPGLNPTAPPPFPINASPYITADSRSSIFYNIVYAYFLAQELKLDQGSIQGLKDTIQQLIEKVRSKQRIIRALTNQISTLQKQISTETNKQVLLISLQKKKQDELTHLKSTIEPKLKQLQQTLENKIKDYTNKKQESKSVVFYKKASKTINEYKKKYESAKKTITDQISNYTKLYKQGMDTYRDIQNTVNLIKTSFTELESELTSSSNNNKEGLSAASYLSSLGMGEFIEVVYTLVEKTGCSFSDFKDAFEKPRKIASTLSDKLHTIQESIKIIQALLEDKQPDKPTQSKSTRPQSIKDIIQTLNSAVRPELQKVQNSITQEISKLRETYKSKVKKALDDIEVFAINLLPIKSSVQDIKDKKQEIEAKTNAIKDKVNKVKHSAELIQTISVLGTSLTSLVSNLTKGNYQFSTNEHNINTIVEGYFDLQIKKAPTDQQESLKKKYEDDKRRLKSFFKILIVLESLQKGLYVCLQEVKSKQRDTEVKEFLTKYPFIQDLIQSLDNPANLSKAVLKVNLRQLNNTELAIDLASIEQRYLTQTLESIKNTCDIQLLQGTKFEAKLATIKATIDKKHSFILEGIKALQQEFNNFLNELSKKFEDLIKKEKTALKNKIDQIQQDFLKKIQTTINKKVNPDATIMSIVFGIAARSFWTGAQWVGTTGSNHIVFNIGAFKPIKASPIDGASAMIQQMADSFQAQLTQLQGLVIPPPNTAIPPIPFVGYK